MKIAFILFPQFTALDIVGPFNVLAYGPDVSTAFVADSMDPVPADVGTLRIPPDVTFADLDRPDVVVVPGGPGWKRVANLGSLSSWLRSVHPTALFTTSVCTGAFALGAAGLLRGRRATTHWATFRHLEEYQATPVAERVVFDGDIVTAAGVSAGIDMALALAARLWGEETAQMIQLANEYDPSPPFAAGTPASAPDQLVEVLRARLDR